jgi:hypothetical protein
MRFYFISLSSTPLTKAHWGCHGSKAMAIEVINFTDEIFESASNVTLCIYLLSRLT